MSFVKYLRLQSNKRIKVVWMNFDILKAGLYKIDKSTKINNKELEHDKINPITKVLQKIVWAIYF